MTMSILLTFKVQHWKYIVFIKAASNDIPLLLKHKMEQFSVRKLFYKFLCSIQHYTEQNVGSILLKTFKILVAYRASKNDVSTTLAGVSK